MFSFGASWHSSFRTLAILFVVVIGSSWLWRSPVVDFFSHRLSFLHVATVAEASKTSNQWLVFTSVGDYGLVETWRQGGSPQFDILAAYYGDSSERLEILRGSTTNAWTGKDAKWPNYYHFRNSADGGRILSSYSAVLLCDDDIDLSVPKVHVLFQTREKYNMTLLAPSFDEHGKVSWFSATRVPNSFMRFGTFIENTCPLFDKTALDRFMSEAYDPTIKGWGVDLLYMWYLNVTNITKMPRSTGVLDVVEITNPPTHKNGIRDIEKNFPERQQNWNNYLRLRQLHHLPFLTLQGDDHLKFLRHNYSTGRILLDGTLLTEGY